MGAGFRSVQAATAPLPDRVRFVRCETRQRERHGVDAGYQLGDPILTRPVRHSSANTLRAKVRGTDQVAVAFFGDGAAASPYYFSGVHSVILTTLDITFPPLVTDMPKATSGGSDLARRVAAGDDA